jgi:hypothetical protein
MDTTTHDSGATLQMGITGATLNIVGILLSGPSGLALVSIVHPSPPWQGAATYAANFHWIQTVPFFGGFALVIGYVIMFAAIYLIADGRQKPAAMVSVIATAAFATLIFFNYICQTTFVPALASDYRPEYDPLITAFSLANPLSLSWAIEMWGYALLGLATAFSATVFHRNKVERAAALLMILNGTISIIGAIVTSFSLGWVLAVPGIVSYAIWNILVFAMAILILVSFRKRRSEIEPASSFSG